MATEVNFNYINISIYYVVLLYVLGLLKCDNLRPFLHTPENWRCMIFLGILEVTRTLYIHSYVVYCMFVTSSLLRFYILDSYQKKLLLGYILIQDI